MDILLGFAVDELIRQPIPSAEFVPVWKMDTRRLGIFCNRDDCKCHSGKDSDKHRDVNVLVKVEVV
jgi:hypothetical protein